ncbi:MAG TPA: heparan-alpha-glucosaminide N-acetyltransferase domain-containing protein [Gemmatimonadaceae bacterium]|nr:heparan-alpha-glucosaminide N-acetyltransferase domain-containing protein [Gemmatimonadaceae bacterium]
MATAAVSAAPFDGVAYAPPARQRVDSIDLLRGLVMVIMMLDHTRDYFSAEQFLFDPTNLDRTSIALFLTRWITHFCAPVFFFLAGTGAYLRRARGATPRELSWFLVSRGVWLIVLELTIIRALITFDVLPRGTYIGQTIWALGWSMIVLAGLVHLPLRVTGAIGVVMVLLHNAFDGIQVPACAPGQPPCGAGDLLLHVLHVPGPVLLGANGPVFLALYPLIPWIGVMAAGYAFGRLYTMDAEARRRMLLRLGGAIVVLFVVLRATNLYGDASKWSAQPRGVAFTMLSFLNLSKYPPSLLYLCMTLGPAILLLAVLERERRGRLGMALVHFGRVPLLFYVLQWIFAHGVAFAAFAATGKPTEALFIFHNNPPEVLARAGFPLPIVYVFWIVGVLALYPICKRYAEVKRRRNDWWLGYL